MKRLHLLTPRPRWTFRGQDDMPWTSVLCIGVLLLASTLLVFGLQRVWLQHQELSELQHSIADAQHRLQRATLASSPTSTSSRVMPRANAPDGLQPRAEPLTAEQSRQLGGVIRQLNTPWQDVFEQLEASTPKEVALISIEPDAKRAVLRLQAEAKTLDALLSYAARLQYQGVLGSLTYSKHETNEQDPSKPIRLSVEYSLQTPSHLQSSSSAKGIQK